MITELISHTIFKSMLYTQGVHEKGVLVYLNQRESPKFDFPRQMDFVRLFLQSGTWPPPPSLESLKCGMIRHLRTLGALENCKIGEEKGGSLRDNVVDALWHEECQKQHSAHDGGKKWPNLQAGPFQWKTCFGRSPKKVACLRQENLWDLKNTIIVGCFVLFCGCFQFLCIFSIL